MDCEADRSGLESFTKRNKWFVLLSSCYAASKVVSAITFLPDLFTINCDIITIFSKDFKHLFTSDSDQIPNSLNQFSKICRSELLPDYLTDFTDEITYLFSGGVITLYQSWTNKRKASFARFASRNLDKLFSTVGSGFLSVIVVNFAKKLATGYFSASASELTVPSNEKFKKVIQHCMQVFLSSPVYTNNANAYNNIFSVFTNPAHQDKVIHMLVSLCNRAVDTLAKTSHPVLITSSSSSSSGLTSNRSPVSPCNERDPSFIENVSPKKLHLNGRVTFETTRSAVDFLLWKLMDGLKISLDVVHDEVVCRGLEVIRYFIAKSFVIVTIFIALHLHVVGGTTLLFPAPTLDYKV